MGFGGKTAVLRHLEGFLEKKVKKVQGVHKRRTLSKCLLHSLNIKNNLYFNKEIQGVHKRRTLSKGLLHI